MRTWNSPAPCRCTCWRDAATRSFRPVERVLHGPAFGGHGIVRAQSDSATGSADRAPAAADPRRVPARSRLWPGMPLGCAPRSAASSRGEFETGIQGRLQRTGGQSSCRGGPPPCARLGERPTRRAAGAYPTAIVRRFAFRGTQCPRAFASGAILARASASANTSCARSRCRGPWSESWTSVQVHIVELRFQSQDAASRSDSVWRESVGVGIAEGAHVPAQRRRETVPGWDRPEKLCRAAASKFAVLSQPGPPNRS